MDSRWTYQFKSKNPKTSPLLSHFPPWKQKEPPQYIPNDWPHLEPSPEYKDSLGQFEYSEVQTSS